MKKLMGFILVLSLVFTNISMASANEEARFEIKIHGQVLKIPESMGKAHIDKNGRSSVPARAIIEGLGYIVKWVGETQTVRILDEEDNVVASLQIGSKVVHLKDGKTIEMDTEAVIGEDGRNYVPLRFVSEALNFEIPKDGGYRFENNTHYVNIVSPSSLKERNMINLADDIDYFNRISLGKDRDENDNYNFLESGELWYDFPMALRNGVEKIKIGRTEDNRPLLYIGIWKEDSNDTIINLCQDIMKYYAKEDSDGDKIFTYVDEFIGNNTKPDETKVMNFGNTTVGFGENDNTKSADFIIELDSLMFDVSLEEVISEDGDVIVIDITNAEVPHYQDRLGRIRIDMVGSVNNSMVGTRPNESSYQDDINTFNKALDGSTWKLSSNGYLQWESEKYDDPNTNLKVVRDNDGNPVVKIRNWPVFKGDESLTPLIMTYNVTAEALKFYSNKKDGEAILWFLDKHFKAGTDPDYNKLYRFGNTTIKIIDPGVAGVDIIFVGNSNEVNIKAQEEVSGDDENVIKVDISKAEVPEYEHPNGEIRIDKVGSVTSSLIGSRKPNSTHAEDVENFNKMLDGSGYKVMNGGSLEFSTSTGIDDPNAPIKIKRTVDDKPVVKVGLWATAKGDEQSYRVAVTMNLACESFKYYSNSEEDALGLYWYLDKLIRAGQDPEYGKVYQFGNTKVMFESESNSGNVMFLD